MRRAPGPAGGTNGSARRGGTGLSSAGRSIVGAPKVAGPARPISQDETKPFKRPASSGSVAAPRRLTHTTHERLASKEKCGSAAAHQVANATATKGVGDPHNQQLDSELREAVLGVFKWCDADSDGILNAAEFAAAQRLVAELCPGDFDEAAAGRIFEDASDGGVGGLVDEEGFLRAMQMLVDTLDLPRHRLLNDLKRQTSRRSSKFDHSVSDFKRALVRNVSNLPEESSTQISPPPLELWRTDTGGHAFSFPPGAADGDLEAQMAFKMMQFLGMKTEDSSFIEGELAAKMMGHRQMFRDILNMCGDIKGVHVVAPGPGLVTADLFLAKSMGGEQMFRIRLTGMQVRKSPAAKLVGMGGFEPLPIDCTEIPAALHTDMMLADGSASQSLDLSALGQAPPPPGLARQRSVMSEQELQDSDLVLTSASVGRHLLRIRFKLADGSHGVARNYLLLVPGIKTAATGHARYLDHEARVHVTGDGTQPQVKPLKNFFLASILGSELSRVVVEHEFTSCQVRVQPRSAAKLSDIVPVPVLSLEERALNLAHDEVEAERLRQLLESQGLGRRDSERDIAYAVRLGRALCRGYEYDVDITEANVKNLTSLIWEKRRGDCSAFNVGFVYALRVFNVPARVSLGFKYGQAVKQACGAVAAPHAESEFYAEGIGWVPCDATLGLKRLGHDGGTKLTFVEWRPANLSLEESEEVAQVLLPPQHVDHSGFCKMMRDMTGGENATRKELAHGIAKFKSLPKDMADMRVAQIIRLCNLDRGPTVPIKQFARGWAAFELGKFTELGAGGGLTSTSKAGAKFYEGGPFKDRPLDLTALKENMMVPDDVEKVIETVGGRAVTHDWSSMWPYGVFLCNYEFEEKPLS